MEHEDVERETSWFLEGPLAQLTCFTLPVPRTNALPPYPSCRIIPAMPVHVIERIGRDTTATLAAFGRVVSTGATVRCSGSAALDLAYVAAGRLDGIWYQRLNSWDMVAGTLMVKEAMGMATDIDGNIVATDGTGSVLATNGLIHRELHKTLKA